MISRRHLLTLWLFLPWRPRDRIKERLGLETRRAVAGRNTNKKGRVG